MAFYSNAPLSYGAFEVTVGQGFSVPAPEDVLAAMSAAGYAGTELGPPGYLGEGDLLRRRLDAAGLELVGGFVPIAFSQPEADLAALHRTLDLFEAAGARSAKPVLADAGSPARRANPGRAGRDPALAADHGTWRRLAEGVERACEEARARGFDPTFHPHGGSWVEAPGEIERLLEDTDVGLLVDTGHLSLGGADPLATLREWRERVNHVHVKDVRLDLLAEGGDMLATWRRGTFCELGRGGLDLEAFVADLVDGGYDGWVVIEQDRVLTSDEDFQAAAEAQERNLQWIEERAR
ncbi:MAG TPA: TIM barrel protein [Thermoleophilaceae bacterium]|nr:TIM barrel protein [Thermoleophilaceae bacterium]